MNGVQHTVNTVLQQVNMHYPSGRAKRETWKMKIVLLVAAAVGLGAIMAGNVLPDIARYLRIRRM
jgi:hypothetical protein